MDWIHCNRCLSRPDAKVKYYITECEKVFCNQCIEVAISSCLKCGHKKCQFIELNNRTNSNVQILFKDVTESFKKLTKVEHFQKCQRSHFAKKLMEENRRLQEEMIQLKQRNDNLENEVKTLKDQILNHNNNSDTPLFPKRAKETNGSNIFSEMFAKENRNFVNQFGESMSDIFSPVPMEINGAAATSLESRLSPLQSIRSSLRLSARHRPNVPDMNSTQELRSSSKSTPRSDFQLPPMKPMTVTNNLKNMQNMGNMPLSRGLTSHLMATMAGRSRSSPIGSSIASSYPSTVNTGLTNFSQLYLNSQSNHSKR